MAPRAAETRKTFDWDGTIRNPRRFFSFFFFSPSHPDRFLFCFVFICRFNLVKFNRLGHVWAKKSARNKVRHPEEKLKEIKQKVVSLWIKKKKKRKVVGWALYAAAAAFNGRIHQETPVSGRNQKGKRNVCNISADETNKKQKRGSRYRIPFSTRPTDQQTGDDEGERKKKRYKI